MPEPTPPTVCVSDANCLKVERAEDGSLALWSSRRPDQRIILDADEVPGWIRPASGDLRARAVEALDDMSDCPPDHWGGRDICDTCVQCEADAVLAAVLPAHRQQIIGELERPDSPLCDCTPDENTPTSPQTGQPMDHHCDCQAVRTASTLLGANSLTRHAQECGHGTRFDEFYRPAATTPPTRPSATEPAESAPAVGREVPQAEAVPLETLVEELGAADPVFRAAAERTALIERLAEGHWRLDWPHQGYGWADENRPTAEAHRRGARRCLDAIALAGLRLVPADVPGPQLADLSRVTRERDEWKHRATELQPAAIHERESLRSENARLRGRIAALDARPLFSTRWVMQALLCAVGDPVDEHALIKRIDGGLTLADVAELAVAAINEPCHDLEAFERQAAELTKLRVQVQAGACPHTEVIGELHLKWLAEVADLKQRILDIDAHATP